ncbi:MAG: 3-dehydroquinate synthase [Pyrinomonadaceae bacterium]
MKIKLPSASHFYEIQFGELTKSGGWAKKILSAAARKVVVVSNRKVFGLYGENVKKSLENAGFEVFTHLIGDGEKYKNFRVLEKTLRFFSECKLKRTDAIIALGGGVVGDLTGFAASIYLRGVAFLQFPTTLLSMIDSSVGGKTAVNSEFGKNLIGTFYQPKGVLIDVNILKTLARREVTAGFCEAVKQGAIGSRILFSETGEFLRKYPVNLFRKHFSNQNFLEELQKFLAAQVAFKAEIVVGDERENAARIDSRSRKTLNFGHTVAHALEKITEYKYFKHGEAVGYGILAAAEISKKVANLSQNDLKSLNDVVRLTGILPSTENIETDKLINAFVFDKKQVGDSLQWILLEEIGKPKILQNKNIPGSIIKKSIEKILKK